MKKLASFLGLLMLSLSAHANSQHPCYAAYAYKSSTTTSVKSNASIHNTLEGTLHIRNKIKENRAIKSMLLMDISKANLGSTKNTKELLENSKFPIQVIYSETGLPQKILNYDERKNELLSIIARDLIYPNQDGSYRFTLDDVESHLQVVIPELNTVQVKHLNTHTALSQTLVLKSLYQLKFQDSPCFNLSSMKGSQQTQHETSLIKAPFTVNTKIDVENLEMLRVDREHWFLQLGFNDEIWKTPPVNIQSSLSKEEALEKISQLIHNFSQHLDSTEHLLELIRKQDYWLIYLPDFLSQNTISDKLSKKLFLILGRQNTSLTVDVLNRVAQAINIHEDHRFRAVTALLTTDAPLSTYMLTQIPSLLNDHSFIQADISSKAYVMSLGAIAANRTNTAYEQALQLQDLLTNKLNNSQQPIVAIINSVGNLKHLATTESLSALERVATTPNTPRHQKVSSLASLARLKASNLSLPHMTQSMQNANEPDVQRAWVSVIANSSSANPMQVKNALLQTLEDPNISSEARDRTALEISTRLSSQLETQDIKSLRKSLPLIKGKKAKSAVYKLLTQQ